MQIGREFIEKIEDMTDKIGIHEENDGRKWSNRTLYPIIHKLPDTLQVSNLSALVDYIESDPDERIAKHDHLIIQIESPIKVNLLSPIFGAFNQREILITAKPELPEVRYGSWKDHESFMVWLQSGFVNTEETQKLKALAGSILNLNENIVVDDGISQVVTTRQSVTSKKNDKAPSIVKLAPFRTFHEVEQPESEFLFRISKDREEKVLLTLFEADGGSWRNEAIQRIKDWLNEKITPLCVYSSSPNIVII